MRCEAQLSLALADRTSREAWIAKMHERAKDISQREGSVSPDRLRELYPDLPDHPNLFGRIWCEPGWACIGYRKSTLEEK